ncbi:MAG: DUF2281 domain-containing protein [Candidatus Promineofilum sp.]|nr:DUF2281 domain-containing protein [Promineifilum sp.]MBP9656911.1 DUF2281 domain-containing protein [Promineifilum sp.]
MTESSMNLEALLAELPEDKTREVIDFAAFLHQQYAQPFRRGSAGAIMQALDETGGLEFDAGELDTLLDDLESFRQLDPIDHA